MPLFRILSNPDPQDGGSSPDLDDDVVIISRAELEALRSRAGDAGGPGAEVSAGVATSGEHLAPPEEARGPASSARKAADWERAFKEALRDRELATALAGRPLVPGGAGQLIRLWRDDFDVYEEGGEYKVSARDGRTVAQAVGDRLASPDFAHFCPPPSRGGTAARGPQQGAPAGTPAAPPRTLGEAVVRRWRESAAHAGEVPRPIGLGRRR